MPHHRFGLWQQCPAGGLRGVALAAPPRQPAPNLRLPHAVRSHLLKLSQPCQGEAGNVTMHLASWQGEDCLWSRASAVHLLLNIVHEGKKKATERTTPARGEQGASGTTHRSIWVFGSPTARIQPPGLGTKQSRSCSALPAPSQGGCLRSSCPEERRGLCTAVRSHKPAAHP